MNMMQAVGACFSKYVTFSGRARRAEYWWFTLFNVIVGLLLGALSEDLAGIYSLAVFLPSISVMVRRLHDIGRSGWWFWIGLIPVVGAIILLVWHATKGNIGPNIYGDDPLEESLREKSSLLQSD